MKHFGRSPRVLLGALFVLNLILGSLQSLEGANAANGKAANLTVTVRVHNYAPIDRFTLAKAQNEVMRIFQGVGVKLLWVECPPSSREFERVPACQHPIGPTGLDLSIVPHAGTLPVSRTTLGFTPMSREGQHVSTVYIFYDRAKEQAEAMRQSLPQILGHAIAHEIGHVLLRTSGHSSTGIMRAQWTAEDLRMAARGELLFTSEQSAFIRSEVLDLTRLQVVTRQLMKPAPNE